jgi:hypothetical protein
MIDTLAVADVQRPEGQSEGPPSGQAEGQDQREREGTAVKEDADQSKDAPIPWYRIVAAAVLLFAAIGLVLWLFLARPDSLARAAVLILLAGAACGGFAVSLPVRLRKVLVPLAIVAGTVIGILAAVLAIPDRSVPTPTPPPPPTSSSMPLPDTDELFDDFENGLQLGTKWKLRVFDGPTPTPQLPKQIYVKNGKLDFNVDKDAVNAELQANIPPGKTLRSISLKMALLDVNGHSAGAAYLITSSAKGRENRVWAGPNGMIHRKQHSASTFASKEMWTQKRASIRGAISGANQKNPRIRSI